MAEKFEDLNLPISVVTRIAKEAMPGNIGIGKEARTALAKAASVFVLYITSASTGIAMKHNRKTINGQDVLKAMEEADFEAFVEPLKEALENFRKFHQERKSAVTKKKGQKDEKKTEETNVEEEEEGDDQEECVEIEDD